MFILKIHLVYITLLLFLHRIKFGFYVELTTVKMRITVEPPVSDHTKCEELVVTYERWSLMRVAYESRIAGGPTHLLFGENVP